MGSSSSSAALPSPLMGDDIGAHGLPATEPETSADDETKGKKPCKACSSCQESRKARDACMLEKGEDGCKDLIEAHKKCLRDHGMKI